MYSKRGGGWPDAPSSYGPLYPGAERGVGGGWGCLKRDTPASQQIPHPSPTLRTPEQGHQMEVDVPQQHMHVPLGLQHLLLLRGTPPGHRGAKGAGARRESGRIGAGERGGAERASGGSGVSGT